MPHDNAWKWFNAPVRRPAWATEATAEQPAVARHLAGASTPPNLPSAPLLTPGQMARTNAPRYPRVAD